MQALRPLTAFRRHLLVMLFACAMLVRMGMPEGWMPVADAAGAWRITICTGTGPLAAAPTMPGMDHARMAMPGMHHDRAPPHDQGDHPCTFAAIGLAAALPDLAPAPFIAPVAAQPAAIVRAIAAVGRGLAAPPPPQTGPPILA
ncbi:MAG TPA: hypothetical protein VM657_09270 [Sphingomonas sp.]|nr:hypothetical protein [Sphingomonas sp.]